MRCPKCSSNRSRVKDSRDKNDFRVVYRRRRCSDCSHDYTTYEVLHGDMVPYTQDPNQLKDDLKALMNAIDLLQEQRTRVRTMIQAQKRGQDDE